MKYSPSPKTSILWSPKIIRYFDGMPLCMQWAAKNGLEFWYEILKTYPKLSLPNQTNPNLSELNLT